MWLCTLYGFFSVVNAKKDGGQSRELDPDRVMIRARREEHLKALRKRFPLALGERQILENSHIDYRWRMVCPKAVWADCVRELVLEQTYPNFKTECGKRFGNGDPYVHALHETWGVMTKLQEAETGRMK